MSAVSDFTVSADSSGPTEALAAAPSMAVDLDRPVAHSREWITPFL